MSNGIVFELAFHFENYEKVTYQYSYTGPTSGSTSQTFEVFGSGLSASMGYQVTSFLRPYFGISRDVITMSSMNYSNIYSPTRTYTATSMIFGFAGIGLDVPLGSSLALTVMADYGTSLVKVSPVQESTETNLMAGLRWGWNEK